MGRLQKEFDLVTNIVGNVKNNVVDRLMFFHIPRVYGSDSNPDEWNCTKWAMHILFGGIPKNFRELVSRTNPGLTREDLTHWLTAYGGSDQDAYMRVLNDINNASFPKFSRVSRGSTGSAGGSRTTKRKTIKMRKTRKMHKYY
jgi:hypothetical protein